VMAVFFFCEERPRPSTLRILIMNDIGVFPGVAGPSAPVANGTAAAQAASAGKRVQTLLLATSLPPEANEEALSTLFQQ
jgi:hypothetical protein